MATIGTYQTNKRRVLFTTSNGKRHTLYLGKTSKTAARDIGQHVDHLIRCDRTGEEPRLTTQEWIATLPAKWPNIAKKLDALQLIQVGVAADHVFADFVEMYIASRKDVAAGTTKTWGQASQKVRQFFGRRTMRSLTVKDGKDFLRWLKTPKELGGAGHKGETPSKHLGHVRGFLNEAVDAEIISINPFNRVRARRTPQPGRRKIVNTADVLRVIAVAPDAEMRAIIALSFWGGLRTPSEHMQMTWGMIRWDEGMMTVKSPKTKSIGKPSREVPLFPELRPYLLEISKQTKATDFIVQARRGHSDSNLRRRMMYLCKRAGVEPWPKIFQNLRSTRQTILEQHYPRGTVCAWMGNTGDVAEAHYIQELKEFRAKAASEFTTPVNLRGGTAIQHAALFTNHGMDPQNVDPSQDQSKERGGF